MSRARRIGRRGVGEPAYSSVAFPVIDGWTVHMNVYLPAGCGGTL